jgi:hypothetical protein
MRPSEFEAIRPHLQEAFDYIDADLKRRQAVKNDKELDELFNRYFAALPQGTPSEMEPHKAPETAPAKLPWASPLCATLIENCQPWRYLSAQSAADLRDCGWIKEAEAIDEVLRGIPTGPIQYHQPKLMAEQLDRCRKGAERIRTILAACLAGSTPPAVKPEQGEENDGDVNQKKVSQAATIINYNSVNIRGNVQGSNVAGSDIIDSSANGNNIQKQDDTNAKEESASPTTCWEKFKKWALNNWFVVILIIIGKVVTFFGKLGSGLQTLSKWIYCFIKWFCT